MSCYGFEREDMSNYLVKNGKILETIFILNIIIKLKVFILWQSTSINNLLTSKKGKRNFDVSAKLHELVSNKIGDEYFYFCDLITYSIFKNNKLVKPKKQDFKPRKPNKDFKLSDNDLEIFFDNKTKTVHYRSDDNNRSIERARNSFLGRAFFAEINRVEFTSKTGGYLKSQTEYDVEDNDFSTGGRVSASFGKYKTSKKYQRELFNL